MINQAQLLAQLQRAQTLHGAGRTEDAWRAIAPMRAAIANHGQGLRLFALIAQTADQIDAAADALLRIIAIEREPPEIVGALADLLGKAGRHDESLTQWTRLTALLPDVADAHLNRAIAADHAGKHDISIAAADAGLDRFASHPRLLAAKAVALKNANRIEESLAVFDLAVAADPNRALTRHNQAVALRKACRFEEACAAYSESERLGSSGSQFYANWAAAALEAGDVASAVEKYEHALTDDPANTEALKALTRLKIEYGVGDDPFAHYRSALEARSSSVEAWRAWVGALLSNSRYDLAIETARRGLLMHPDEVMLAAQMAFAAGMSGDAAPAVDRLEQLFADSGEMPLPWMAQLAIRAGQFDRAADYALRTAATDFNIQGAWSILSIAWRMLDDPREHWLCDYDRLVMVTDVPSSDGKLNPADYAALMAGVLDPLHNTIAAPGDQSLRQGTQTSGNLFDRPEPQIRLFREAVRQAAEQAVAGLPDDPKHPFLSRKSSRLGFSGSWSVRLHGGGHHVSHFHNQGWMSSAYYARLPNSSPAAKAGHEGWIQFGSPPDMYALDLPPRRLIEPEVGKLVLFPSYMLHGTVPFQSGDRLTAAFDYQPA